MRERDIANFIVKYRFIGIILPLFLCIVCIFFIPEIKIETRHLDFIPTRHHFVSVQQSLNQLFGGLNRVNIAIETRQGDILQPHILKKIKALAEDIQLLDEVNPRRVYSLFAQNVKYIEIRPDGFSVHKLIRQIPQTPLEINALREKIKHNPLVYGPIVSKDFKATLIQADFRDGVSSKQIYNKIKKIVNHYKSQDVVIYLSGYPILEGYIDEHLSFILYVFIVALVIILSLLFVAFRKKRGFLLPLVAGSVSVGLSLAAFNFLHYKLNPFTILIPFLIFVLTVSHSVQFMERYFEESRSHADRKEIARKVLTSLLNPIRASLFTDFLGFASLILIPIPGIHSIAILGSLGVLSIFLSVIIFLPACFAIFPLPRFRDINNNNLGVTAGILQRFIALWQKKWQMYLILLIFIFLFIIAIYGSRHIEVGEVEPGTSILYWSAPYNVAERKINRYFAGSNPYYILVEGKAPEALLKSEVMQEMDDLEKFLSQNADEAGYSLSVADYIKLMHLAVQHHFAVPNSDKTIGEYIFLYESNSFPGVFDAFITPDHHFANIRLDLKDCRGKTIEKIIELTRTWLEKFHHSKWVNFDYAGGLIGILGATNAIIKEGLIKNMAIMSLLIFIRIILALRSFTGGLLLFVPLGFSIALTFGSFGLFHIPFTVATLPVAAMGTGLGVDYSIYLAARIKEEREKGVDLLTAVNKSVLTCGKAVFFTGSIITIGVWSWVWSNLKLQAKLGGALGFLLLINMLAALIILPVVILLFKPSFLGGKDEKMVD
ncbi:MAG: MMPL family transporter [Candidatus Desulfofervidaceae bacterium]|nr:MMPL family transporter [Candidatus Desulfofervidaceae bacterium]